jgi:xylulokinase
VTLLLGLDVGTTSVKAVVYGPDGIAVGASSLPTPTHVPRPGWAYFEPNELWATCVGAIRRAIAELPDAAGIASVAVASMGESGVLLDAEGHATAASIAWYDNRTRPQARWLAEQVGKDELFARSGLSLQPIFSLNKLLWHREHQPESWRRSVRWLMMADYIAFRLSGEQATDLSLASRTLMLDLQGKRWDQRTLEQTGIAPGLLAPLAPSGTSLGAVTPAAAAETGLPPSTLVSTGGHDHVCGALAAGVTRPGQMLNSLGTAEALFLPTDEPLTDPRAGREGYTQGAHVVGGGYYAFAGQYTSGASIDWLRKLLGTGDDAVLHEALIAGAGSVPAGSLGVLFLPHLRLANPPYDDPRSRGALIGLTADAGRDVVARAIFEGLAMESRSTFEPLLAYPQVVAPRSVVAIGGSTRNALLMRIKASVFNLEHDVVAAEEATALGAALLGGLGAGVYRDVDEAVGSMRYGRHVVPPDLREVDLYETIFTSVYRRFYRAVAPLSRTISDLQLEPAAAQDFEA